MSLHNYAHSAFITVAKVALSLVVTFIALNLVIYGGYALSEFIFRRHLNAVTEHYRTDITRYYPRMTAEQINDLMRETYAYLQYEPFVEFREHSRTGRYVNILEPGYRRSSGQSEWPPRRGKPVIFVFGGSTTLGAGVGDDDTVVSRLSDILRLMPEFADAQIYNFGRGFYFSTQEAILFMRLLSDGTAPDIAIFIDGLNEFFYQTNSHAFAREMKVLFEREVGKQSWSITRVILADAREAILYLPIGRLAHDIKSYFAGLGFNGRAARFMAHNKQGTENSIKTFLANRRMIMGMARAFNVKTLFVWQPIASRTYPPTLHAELEVHGYGPHSQSYFGYPEMKRTIEAMDERDGFVWCADAFSAATEPLYVDLVHYNRSGAELLARCIADGLAAGPN
jgi:hypothetical protein